MHRTVAIALIGLACFVFGRLSSQGPVNAEGQAEEHGHGAGVPLGNGDVNADGRLDIADAIYIINNQFLGGPEPVPYEDPELLERIAKLEADLASTSKSLEECSSELATVQSDLAAKSAALDVCSGELGSVKETLETCESNLQRGGLPVTGQTTCYDAAGGILPCDSADFRGQDGLYQAGCPDAGRFVGNGDGTVTDNCTGLMWQRELAPGAYNWQAALHFCETLVLAGHSDWRLPSIKELHSLVDYGRYPAVPPMLGSFPHACMSSTTTVQEPDTVWSQDFSQGWIGIGSKAGLLFVRAVRSAR